MAPSSGHFISLPRWYNAHQCIPKLEEPLSSGTAKFRNYRSSLSMFAFSYQTAFQEPTLVIVFFMNYGARWKRLNSKSRFFWLTTSRYPDPAPLSLTLSPIRYNLLKCLSNMYLIHWNNLCSLLNSADEECDSWNWCEGIRYRLNILLCWGCCDYKNTCGFYSGVTEWCFFYLINNLWLSTDTSLQRAHKPSSNFYFGLLSSYSWNSADMTCCQWWFYLANAEFFVHC